MLSIGQIGDQTSDVRYTGEAIDSPIYLEWGGIGKYGTDSEVGNYLLNHDEACDYGEVSDPAEIEECVVSGNGI